MRQKTASQLFMSANLAFAGRIWRYDFRQLTTSFDEEAVAKVTDSLLQRYARLAKVWNPQHNSEWICRTYFAGKMILAATLSANSLKYAEGVNLRPVIHYLRYYTLLSLFRAVVLLLPEKQWNDGQLLSMSHRVAINEATSFIATLDVGTANSTREQAVKLKTARELISYHAPSSGDELLPHAVDFSLFELLADLAQFSSELLDQCVERQAPEGSFVFLNDFAAQLYTVDLGGIRISDREDRQRLNYLSHKLPYPVDLKTVLTEGHVESFFGSWCEEDPTPGHFDPDGNWQLLFDLS